MEKMQKETCDAVLIFPLFHGSVISFHHPVGHLASSTPQRKKKEDKL
jgi:hypothetical protein